jgi:L-alanine-DL-glutamate epimerase-like enolase superfamily enzyme
LNESVQSAEVAAYRVPTDFPESDGTAAWDSTTLILVELGAGKVSGLGYTYAHDVCAPFIRETLFPLVRGKNPLAIPELWNQMNTAVRNFGRPGVAMSAIAAVEIALWDLKARLLEVPLAGLLGTVRAAIPVYGSGGFTSYSHQQLRAQFENWVGEGMTMVKMKIGREPGADGNRVKAARQAIGEKTQLFVDANGAYTPKQAVSVLAEFLKQEVRWYEEPVSSDDLAGLNFVRAHAPAPVEIAAGEYNYDAYQARRMLETGAVDVLQADATRAGITGFLRMAALCEAFQTPLSAHTAPALHTHLCCAAARARHVEYFYDHSRIEQMFFEGTTTRHKNGFLAPDLSQPGLGLAFKRADAEPFKINL